MGNGRHCEGRNSRNANHLNVLMDVYRHHTGLTELGQIVSADALPT